MKLFTCPHCSARLYFENAQCLTCGSAIAYSPDEGRFILAAEGFRCLNADQCDCNWAADEGRFCRACELNKTIPDLSIEGNRARWVKVERAKRRAIYSMLAFGLPVGPKMAPDDEVGLAFDFLAPIGDSGPGAVLTGHDNGLITLNVAEADASEREKMRAMMGENYRTLLGHFRHELGHYYWDRLIRDNPAELEAYRSAFGDETADYDQAIAEHYANGAPANWQASYISPYAASHPWEDWAESFAHYLHITDTLEMVRSLRLPLADLNTVGPDLPEGDQNLSPVPRPTDPDDHAPEPFDRILARWLVLSEASNSINRCMGLPDLYPFVLSPPAAAKLGYIHELLGRQAAS